MQKESRVQRWRANKRERGLKQVSVWLTPEAELRLKDMAIQWHCSPSEVVQRALAQVSTSASEHSSPTDTLRIRKLILAELAALGITLPGVTGSITVGSSVGPPDTLPRSSTPEPSAAQQYEADPGHSLLTEPAPARKGGRPRSELGQRILALLQEHPEGLTAEQLRGTLTPTKSIGDLLAGMRRTGVVTARKEGRGWRYFLVQ